MMALKNILCLISTLAIFWLCNGHQTYTINLNGTLEPAQGPNCTTAGFICDGCLTSYNCYQLPNGTWVKQLIENCNATVATCLATTGLCTTEPNQQCRRDFRCSQIGIFPDLTDCNKYHICVSGPNGTIVDYPEDCAEGFSYSPLTRLCSKPRTANCTIAAPTCNGTSSTVALLENNRMFYQCSQGSLAPDVLYCSPDHIFVRGICHDMNENMSVENGTCVGDGRFYRPNCTTFSNCYLNEPALIDRCINNNFFNYNTNLCNSFTCNRLFL